MQEALRQGCRRSARLLQRAAPAGATAATLPAVTRALHHEAENPDAATQTSKGRRRRTATTQQQQDAQAQAQQQQGASAFALKALGSITNRPDVLDLVTAAAAAAAGTPTPDADSPAAKRPRGRRARATAPATSPAAADPTADTQQSPAAAVPAPPKPDRQSRKGASKASSKSSSRPSRAAEQHLWGQGYHAVAGVDEAGRGPLAGPVVAAAAVLPPDVEFDLLRDSKQMTEADREAVYEQLTTHPGVSYAVALLGPDDIDQVNILEATMVAMRAAVSALVQAGRKPEYLLVDGNRCQQGLWGFREPGGSEGIPQEAVVKGDATVTCIAAASVLAKVTRDHLLVELDKQYPLYGFAQHKGYGTAAHRAAIHEHGPCPAHRRSFEPIKSLTQWPGYPGGSPKATIIAHKAAADVTKA